MDSRLKGKVALVSGATSGIGKDIAIAFAREGAKVALTGRDSGRLAEVEGIIKAVGGETIGIQADLSRLSEIDRVIQETITKFNGLDILVNSAGVFEPHEYLETSEELYDRVMAINLKSVFFLSQKAAWELKKKGRGKIIILASIGGGVTGFPMGSTYCASKGAVVSLIQSIALELAPYKINVNAISPGNIRTPIAKERYDNPEYIQAIAEMTPLGRIGETSDIIPAAIYLASEDSDYVTGIQIVIDGGLSRGILQLPKKSNL